jgi:hypothetical protein
VGPASLYIPCAVKNFHLHALLRLQNLVQANQHVEKLEDTRPPSGARNHTFGTVDDACVVNQTCRTIVRFFGFCGYGQYVISNMGTHLVLDTVRLVMSLSPCQSMACIFHAFSTTLVCSK